MIEHVNTLAYRIATMAGAALVAGAALLFTPSPAGAQTAPPTAAGNYNFVYNGRPAAVTVAHDCGPDCFSVSGRTAHWEMRLQPQGIWVDPTQGVWTGDGVAFTTQTGNQGTLIPA